MRRELCHSHAWRVLAVITARLPSSCRRSYFSFLFRYLSRERFHFIGQLWTRGQRRQHHHQRRLLLRGLHLGGNNAARTTMDGQHLFTRARWETYRDRHCSADGLPGGFSVFFCFCLGNCEDWNVTFHYYDDSWPGKLGQAVHYLCPDVDKHVFTMPDGMNVMAIW